MSIDTIIIEVTREPEGKRDLRSRPYSKLISPKLFLDHFRFWKSQIANRVTRITSRGQPMRRKAHTTPEDISKGSFIPTIRPTVHTNPSRKRSFSKTLFIQKEFDNNNDDDNADNNEISQPEFSSATNLACIAGGIILYARGIKFWRRSHYSSAAKPREILLPQSPRGFAVKTLFRAPTIPPATTNPKWPLIVAFSNSFGVVLTENI